jgi:hypothetical protein
MIDNHVIAGASTRSDPRKVLARARIQPRPKNRSNSIRARRMRAEDGWGGPSLWQDRPGDRAGEKSVDQSRAGVSTSTSPIFLSSETIDSKFC